MVVRADDNDVRGVVVLRTGEVVNVVGLDNAVAIRVANLLAANLVAIVVEPLQGQDNAAVNTAILHQPLLLLNRSRLVGHEELVVVALLVNFLGNGAQRVTPAGRRAAESAACSCPVPVSAQTGTHSSFGTQPVA